MKKSFLAIALSLAIPAAIAAGLASPDAVGPPRGPNLDRLAQALNLTDQQKTDLKAIFADQGKKRRALREETRARMQEVLTAEQLAQLDEMRQSRKARHGGKFCNKPPRQSGQ